MLKAVMTTMMAATTIVAVQPAAATTTPKPAIAYQKGNYALPSWTTAKVFEDFESGATPKSYEHASGDVSVDRSTSGNHYLDIGPGGTYSISFATPEQVFSFAFISLAGEDRLTLGFANGTSTTLSGLAMLGLATADVASQWGRVTFDMQGKSGITSALFANTGDCNGFLIDGLAAATPEPATWGLMIVGFGLAGAALRRRRPAPARAAVA